jgi:hypothetical protein
MKRLAWLILAPLVFLYVVYLLATRDLDFFRRES